MTKKDGMTLTRTSLSEIGAAILLLVFFFHRKWINDVIQIRFLNMSFTLYFVIICFFWMIQVVKTNYGQ